MSDWSAGYVTDIGYTYGYYPELNPLRVRLAFLNMGLAAPEFGAACELGFGQGVSINMHAAATSTPWWGNDFNPAQVGFARELAQVSGAPATLLDDDFEKLARRDDLPEFDYIGLHGIWSWISDANRRVIVDFIDRKLKVGGVVYVSYNTLPGWAGFMPMRHLMAQHAQRMSATGAGMQQKVVAALGFAERLAATQPNYMRAIPGIPDRLKRLREQPTSYVAHEYFNRDWQPMYFSDMAQWLSAARMEYACSAQPTDLVDAVNLTADQRKLLGEVADPLYRETLRDYMVNQQFRRDYWVKGVRRLTMAQQEAGLRQLRVVLLTPRADVPKRYAGVLGEAALSDQVYDPLLEALGSQQPMTLDALDAAVRDRQVNFLQLRQALLLLAASGHVQIAQDDAAIARVRERTAALNAHLMQRAHWHSDQVFLASPVTGGGISVGRIQQLFAQHVLQAQQGRQDAPQAEAMAQRAWQILNAQGHRVIKDGRTLDGPQANLAELAHQATLFLTRQLPALKALQIV